MNNIEYDPWDEIQLSPEDSIDVYKSKPESEKDPWDELDFGEDFWTNAFRTALQIPQGVAEGTGPGIAAGLWQLLSQGEVLDPENIDNLRMISEREGIPFDEEAYMEAAQKALGTVPTVSNIGSKVEEMTGVPFEPKTRTQKALRLGSTAAKFQPGAISQKAAAGVAAPAVSNLLQEAGVPEPFAELAGLGAAVPTGGAVPAIDVSLGKTKPSGIPARQFENLKNPTEVKSKKFQQINEKLEKDFKSISDKIIKESPIGETAENLKNDPTYKLESRELLDQAQEIADAMPGTLPSKDIKKAYIDTSAKKVKGFALDEYDKSYLKFMKDSVDDIKIDNVTPGQLVEMYRKNNRALGEYFEPGASKALNRAKRDALLDQNRSIADIIEKSSPELSTTFKEGNARWTKIMDAEAVDDFINKVFEEKVNYKKMHDFFDKEGYGFKFKRALGEEGYKQFQTLMKDMLTSEAPYKMLKVAKTKGWGDLFETAGAYILHPSLGKAKLAYNVGKNTFKSLMNSMLDKPQLAITWKRGVDNLKKGNFQAAAKEFEDLKAASVEVLPAEEVSKTKPEEPKTIEAPKKQIEYKKPEEKIRPVETFETEKGSTYQVNEDGSTTRNKAYRPEHGEKEQGIQPNSEKTWYVSKEDADKLSLFQTSGSGKRLIEFDDGRLGIMYETGKDAGKVEARTIIIPQSTPAEGLLPVESWEGGKKIHFGNKITKIKKSKTKTESKKIEPIKRTIEQELQELQDSIKNTKSVISSTKDPKIEKMFRDQLVQMKKEETILLKEIKKKETLKKPQAKTEFPKEKVEQVKHQDISKKGLKEQKYFILEKIDDALTNPDKYGDYIDFHVPGDGDMKLKNHPKALEQFRKSVDKRWPDKALPSMRKGQRTIYPEHDV